MKITKCMLTVAIGVVALVAPRTARADDIVYTVNGTFDGGATTLSGTLTIDSTTGQTINGTVSTTGDTPEAPLSLGISFQPALGLPGEWAAFFNDGGLPTIDFEYIWPPSNLSSVPLIVPGASDPPGICGGTACGVFVGTTKITEIAVFDGGTLTEVTAPEPSSLPLLGIGLLGVLAMGLYKKQIA